MASLEEHRARLATEPLTGNQLGAVHREFERLGYGRADRAARLEISARLAGYPGKLASTKDLTMGEAGRLVGALRACRAREDLYAAASSSADSAPGVLGALVLALVRSWIRTVRT